MNKIKLTKTAVEKLPFAEKGKQVDYLDTELEGFGIRVSATGKKYFVRRLLGAKRVRVMIGSHPIKTAEEARGEARIKLGIMESGVDPNEDKRQARKQAQADKKRAMTLKTALDEYLQKGNLKPRTVVTYQKLFQLYLSDWLQKPALEITRDMVKNRHREIASGKRTRQLLVKGIYSEKTQKGTLKLKLTAAPAPKRREAAADNTMRTLRAVLNYTFEDEENGTPYANPVNVLSSRKSKAWFKVDRRRTLIKNSDLPAWHKAVMRLENGIMRDYLLFLLFTGLRRQEAATLTWQQVDFREGCFTVVDTKNSEPHTLPLSDYLYSLLEERKEGLKNELAEATAALHGITSV